MRADVSVFSRDALKDEEVKKEDDLKTANTSPTLSTLTMEKFTDMRKIVTPKEHDEELPSKLLLLSENFVSGEKLNDEVESLTLNTMSTLRIPSSLDTRTEEIPPSLDTKTLSRTLAGLQLMDSTIGDMTTPREDAGRNISNRSKSRRRNLYDIERVPSLVDTYGNDDGSMVSAISADSGAQVSKGIRVKKEPPIKKGVEAQEPIRKRLFRGKGKILRPWSWKNKKVVQETLVAKVPSVWREPLETVRHTQDIPKTRPNESTRPSVTAMKPTKPFVPSPVPRHTPRHVPKSPPRIRREYPTASPALTVPAIKATKSNDITASTIGTDEEDRDNVPFDEPINTFSPPRFQTIEKIRVGRYLRPSSNVEVREI